MFYICSFRVNLSKVFCFFFVLNIKVNYVVNCYQEKHDIHSLRKFADNINLFRWHPFLCLGAAIFLINDGVNCPESASAFLVCRFLF